MKIPDLKIQAVATLILLSICLAAVFLLCYDEVSGHSVDQLVQNLIAFSVGIAGTVLGYHSANNSNGGTPHASS